MPVSCHCGPTFIAELYPFRDRIPSLRENKLQFQLQMIHVLNVGISRESAGHPECNARGKSALETSHGMSHQWKPFQTSNIIARLALSILSGYCRPISLFSCCRIGFPALHEWLFSAVVARVLRREAHLVEI
jgi:hypothetical protein